MAVRMGDGKPSLFWQFKQKRDRKRKTESSLPASLAAGSSSTPKREMVVVRERVREPIEYARLLICNYSVKLPPKLTPYPTQRTMIGKILRSLNSKSNALIESPTGSGKTLGLLASTCAWLAKYKEENEQLRKECLACNPRLVATSEGDGGTGGEPGLTRPPSTTDPNVDTTPIQEKRLSYIEQEFEKDFYSPNTPTITKEEQENLEYAKRAKLSDSAAPEGQPEHTCRQRVVIYYCTRTHKQIGQVVKEFSRLPYGCDGVLKHTILASREHSCINKAARASADLNGKCKELIAANGVGCPFKNSMRGKFDRPYQTRKLISQNGGEGSVWDIEELVERLTFSSPSICPYFVSTRVLTMDADIIFCPFTYLIDPIIRESSDVHLKNAVVILDEAHNVEDVCREAVSFDFTEKELVLSRVEFLKKVGQMEVALDKKRRKATAEEGLYTEEDEQAQVAVVEKFERLLDDLRLVNKFLGEALDWFVTVSADAMRNPVRDDKQTSIFTWTQLYTSLEAANLLRFGESGKGGAQSSLLEALTNIGGMSSPSEENSASRSVRDFAPNDASMVCVEKFVYFFRVYFRGDHRTTYKLCVCIDKPFGTFASRSRTTVDSEAPTDVLDMSVFHRGDQQWLDSKAPLYGYKEIKHGHRVTASLWCMLPAVAYQDAFSDCRSVILASGTLCPVDTFQTELGTHFQEQMEGNQVIPKEQIFATVVPSGPTGYRLCGTYRNINSDNRFLHELSMVVKNVCEAVPKGILIFVASYRFLDQFYEYMETCGTLRQIQNLKHIMREPRRSSQLNAIMTEYEKAVDEPELFGTQCTGALLFAVFRGKCSEGIDFTDDRARCVISVGIPFPNVRDEQVLEKKKFNDQNCKTLRVLSGDEWYTMQAYRALNQALGRCLRHRNDWGAILMVDDRLLQNRANPNAKKVSKWIREQLRIPKSYDDFISKLSNFVTDMRKTSEPAESTSLEAVASSDSILPECDASS